MGLGPKSPGAERHPPHALSRDVLLLVGLSADLDRGPPARGGVRQVSPGNVASSACTLASAGPSACWAELGRLRLLSSRRCPHTRRGTARGCDRPRLFSRLLFISTRPRVVIHRCVIYSRAQIVPALAAGTLLFGSRVPSNVPVILYMSVFGFWAHLVYVLPRFQNQPRLGVGGSRRQWRWVRRWVRPLLSRCRGLSTLSASMARGRV